MKHATELIGERGNFRHHPLKMRVPIEASTCSAMSKRVSSAHHPLKMRVPIEASVGEQHQIVEQGASPSENEGPY